MTTANTASTTNRKQPAHRGKGTATVAHHTVNWAQDVRNSLGSVWIDNAVLSRKFHNYVIALKSATRAKLAQAAAEPTSLMHTSLDKPNIFRSAGAEAVISYSCFNYTILPLSIRREYHSMRLSVAMSNMDYRSHLIDAADTLPIYHYALVISAAYEIFAKTRQCRDALRAYRHAQALLGYIDSISAGEPSQPVTVTADSVSALPTAEHTDHD